MHAKTAAIVGTVLGLNMALSAMVIQSHCEKGDESIRTESGVFNEDYLFLGHELNFSGEVEDLVFLGKRLTVTGSTKLGLISLCKDLIHSGTSGNGVIAGAMNVVINGTITGNNYVGCKSLALSDVAVVNGNLFAGCAKLLIDGKLNGDLYTGAGEIVINNEIQGNVTAHGGRIIIGEKGRINGNLVYSVKEALSAADLAKVAGTVTVDNRFTDKDWSDFAAFMKSFGFLIGIGLCISCVITGLLLLFLPAFRKLDAPQPERTFWRTSLWGLIPVLMYPAIIVFCFAMVITIPLAVMLLLAAVPLFFVAYVIGITLTGKYLVMKLRWNVRRRHYQFLIGGLAGCILLSIPGINFLFFLLVTALGWGMYTTFLFGRDLSGAEKVA